MVEEFTLEGQLSENCQTIQIKNGRVLSRIIGHLREKALYVLIKPLSYKRTDAQNRYYWGVCIPCIRAWHKETTGESIKKEEAHAYVLSKVIQLEPKFKEVFGEEVMYFDAKTTSQMNTKEFNEFKEKVQSFFYKMGCNIPDPRGNNLMSDYA